MISRDVVAEHGTLTIGSMANETARIEVITSDPASPLRLTEREVLLVIEAFAVVYADLCGARPESIARGVNRTLRNRTRAARENRSAEV
jgi:hypothetical protein